MKRVRARVVLGCQLLLSNSTSVYSTFCNVTEAWWQVAVKPTLGTGQENVMCSLITRPLRIKLCSLSIKPISVQLFLFKNTCRELMWITTLVVNVSQKLNQHLHFDFKILTLYKNDGKMAQQIFLPCKRFRHMIGFLVFRVYSFTLPKSVNEHMNVCVW